MGDQTAALPELLIYAGGSVFGRLLAADLLAHTPARLLLVGPDGGPEREAARDLDPGGTRVQAARADLEDARALDALLAGKAAAVCCVRGFQGVPSTLVDACATRGVAYFDIADSRSFVHRVLGRRAEIEAGGITAGTGLGLLPGLSALMTRHAVSELDLYEIARVDVSVYIGSHRARGVGALAAALRCAGRPLARNVYGWSGRQRADFPPPIGRRKVYNFDAPDYDLFPALFGIRQDRVRVRLGFELDLVNRGLAALGLLRRMGWRWRYKGPLIMLMLGMSAPLRAVGEDNGAVLASVRGIARRPGHHAVIRAGTLTINAPDARLLMVLPCAEAVARYLDGRLPSGLLDWRLWIEPVEMWDALRARGLTVTWRLE
ncbi:MAG TPA: saccharopine dehydrogenase NADP-binding domain-containing protein [Chloroflexia bacterium]|nr:saccharopine dehydrogenase NADP-binding domain-containing protein [Chloroflexia bacterium]